MMTQCHLTDMLDGPYSFDLNVVPPAPTLQALFIGDKKKQMKKMYFVNKNCEDLQIIIY